MNLSPLAELVPKNRGLQSVAIKYGSKKNLVVGILSVNPEGCIIFEFVIMAMTINGLNSEEKYKFFRRF